jgi:hypothetical protein
MLVKASLPEPTRFRLFEETDHNIAILEDRYRLLDEVMALRQERDALLSCRARRGYVEDDRNFMTSSRYVQYPPTSYRAFQITSTGIRQCPVVVARVEPHPLTIRQHDGYTPTVATSDSYPYQKPLQPQPQPTRSAPAVSPHTVPLHSPSMESLEEIENHKTTPCMLGTMPLRNRKLPQQFRLSPNTVVLGKGKGAKEASGNIRLKELVHDHLEEYVNCGRHGKMVVISKIIRQVQLENNYKNVVVPAFVRFQDNCWWEVTERECRIKLSATFRDLLSDNYRSSSKSKVEHRRHQRQRRKEISDIEDAVIALSTLKA